MMEIFYATVVACWIGVGCMFGEWPKTYDEKTCGNANKEMEAELVERGGQPKKWEFACVTDNQLDAMVIELGVEREPR